MRQLAGSTRTSRPKTAASPESLRRQLDDALAEIDRLREANARLEARVDSLLQASQ